MKSFLKSEINSKLFTDFRKKGTEEKKMTVQDIRGWTVLDNGKPAVLDNNTRFNKCFYTDFGQALSYAKDWLGEYDTLAENWQGELYDYSGYGDTIEIRFQPGIEL